jgi:hypothetical protein
MKNTHYLPLLILLHVCAGRAATVDTEIFSIDIPDQWKVEDNKSDVILAMGNRVRDRTPLPFLSIQYCTVAEPSAGSTLRRCENPCTDESLAFLAESQPPGFKVSAVTKDAKPNGVVEYSVEATAARLGGIAFATLSCSTAGQAYVSLVSDQSEKETKRVFSLIIESIKWK